MGIKNSNAVLTIEEITNCLIPVFVKYNIRRAVLFGSYSKKTASSKSDIDLFVDSNLRGLKFVGLIESIRVAVGGKDVDVFDVTHIDRGSLVEKEIINTGIEIYARQ